MSKNILERCAGAMSAEEFEGLNEEAVLSLIRCRLAELKRVGCESADCVVLAGRADVDLEGAADLVARGCPADLALRILL